MKRLAIVIGAVALAAGCAAPSVTRHMGSQATPPPQVVAPLVERSAARLLFVGDVMLGRGVGADVGDDPNDLFREARSAIGRADLAAFNLESPLTTRPHLASNPNDLRADPTLALALAAAGFDVASLANNHAGDAGTDGVADSAAALESAGVATIGIRHAGSAPSVILDVRGVRVGMAAFTQVESDSLTGATNVWDEGAAEAEVRRLAASSDVVAVAFHGGSEGIPVPDSEIITIAERLATWGADIVWGHGPHVPHRLEVIETEAGRHSIIATSLGNFLFDQNFEPNQSGHVLEILTTGSGPVAYRLALARHTTSGVESIEWVSPADDAVYIGGEWWSPVNGATPEPVASTDVPFFEHGDVISAAWGDVTGDGTSDLVVAYRHPFRETPLNRIYPDRTWTDEHGRSAHIGVFTSGGAPVWGAGTLAYPIDEFAPCDGSIAVAYRTFAGDAAGVGALVWQEFGLFDAPVLPGGARRPVSTSTAMDASTLQSCGENPTFASSFATTQAYAGIESGDRIRRAPPAQRLRRLLRSYDQLEVAP